MTEEKDKKKSEEKMPDDFEECGYCGFDHEYEYEAARKWHEENDPGKELYK